MRHNQTTTRFLIACAVLIAGSPAEAMDARMAKTLMKVDPDTRLEQACDIEAMHRVGKGTKLRPDRAKSDISAHPIHQGDTMKAPGAAFRSKGLWYALSFECTGTTDHLGVLSFSFKVGKPIPKSLWADLGCGGEYFPSTTDSRRGSAIGDRCQSTEYRSAYRTVHLIPEGGWSP